MDKGIKATAGMDGRVDGEGVETVTKWKGGADGRWRNAKPKGDGEGREDCTARPPAQEV